MYNIVIDFQVVRKAKNSDKLAFPLIFILFRNYYSVTNCISLRKVNLQKINSNLILLSIL